MVSLIPRTQGHGGSRHGHRWSPVFRRGFRTADGRSGIRLRRVDEAVAASLHCTTAILHCTALPHVRIAAHVQVNTIGRRDVGFIIGVRISESPSQIVSHPESPAWMRPGIQISELGDFEVLTHDALRQAHPTLGGRGRPSVRPPRVDELLELLLRLGARTGVLEGDGPVVDEPREILVEGVHAERARLRPATGCGSDAFWSRG